MEHDIGGVIGGQLVVSTEYPQLGRVLKRMLSIAQFVQQTPQSLHVKSLEQRIFETVKIFALNQYMIV